MLTAAWVLAYGALFAGGELLSEKLGCPHAVTAAVLVVYMAALLFHLRKSGAQAKYGLCPVKGRSMWALVPLLLIPVMNFALEPQVSIGLWEVPVLACAALAEELFFRGALPGYIMEKLPAQSGWTAALLSALAFSAFHLAGLLSGLPLPYVAVQLALAFGAGAYLGALAFVSGSILPGAAVHFLINISSGGGAVQGGVNYAFYLVAAALLFVFAYLLWKREYLNRQGKN